MQGSYRELLVNMTWLIMDVKVNVGKSKVSAVERAREQNIDFAEPYRVTAESSEKEMKAVEFKYLLAVLFELESVE